MFWTWILWTSKLVSRCQIRLQPYCLPRDACLSGTCHSAKAGVDRWGGSGIFVRNDDDCEMRGDLKSGTVSRDLPSTLEAGTWARNQELFYFQDNGFVQMKLVCFTSGG